MTARPSVVQSNPTSSNPTKQEAISMSTFDTPEPISATIDLSIANLHISTSDRGATAVDVLPSDVSDDEDRKAAEVTRVEFSDGELVIRSPKLRSWLSRRGGSVDVMIDLPAGSHVRGTLGVGDIRAEGHLGGCEIKLGLGRIALERADTLRLRSGAGDISVDRVTGRAEVTTGAGGVRLGELDQSAVIKNSNGDTWVGVAGGDLRLNAANGNITVDLAQASVGARSANGHVRLGEVVRGSVVLETGLGNLEVGIREGTAAWLDVNSRFGHVHNGLDAAGTPETSAETVEVRARTSIGEVVIRRA
jgi:DUF4097 and DUF4098 domain-containing protein YvlB